MTPRNSTEFAEPKFGSQNASELCDVSRSFLEAINKTTLETRCARWRPEGPAQLTMRRGLVLGRATEFRPELCICLTQEHEQEGRVRRVDFWTAQVYL